MTKKYHNEGGLYRPEFERDNCGFGLIAQMDGKASHWLISTAISALARLTHRGAVAADGRTGDGCGILMAMPDAFMRQAAKDCNYSLAADFATGLVFLSNSDQQSELAKSVLNEEIKREGMTVAGWRIVPTEESALGEQAKQSVPVIEQIFVNAAEGDSQNEFERKLFLSRRRAEKRIWEIDADFYIPVSYTHLTLPTKA